MTVTETKGPASRLARVVRGRLEKPLRVVLYATDGLGKSTFASNAPSPVFLGAEDGTAQLDVARMPDLESWDDLLESVDELANAEHDFKTVVLDTADWAEPMCWAHVAAAARKPDVEAIPYGKGYVAALDQWRLLLSKLEKLRAVKGMHIIILAHAAIRTFRSPDSDDYDRHEMKLHPRAAGLLREWADCVLFGTYETFTHEHNGRTKGVSTGARIVHTQRTAAFDAKNRYDLPESMPLDWQTFMVAVKAHRPADPAALKARVDALLAKVTDEALKQRVGQAVTKASGNAAQLAKIADHLNAQIQITEKENAR